MFYSAADVAVVIPCLSPDYAERFLGSCLSAIEACPDQPGELRVMDDRCRYEDATGELGFGFFSRALNDGVAEATCPLVCALNVDTEPRAGWLERMAREFDDPEVGMVGCRLVRPDGSLQHAGVTLLPGGAGGVEIREERPTGDVQAVTAACALVRRVAWEQVDGMDESFDLGNEDVDMCVRLTNAGWRIRYVAEATVLHHESPSPKRWRSTPRNVERLREKWASA